MDSTDNGRRPSFFWQGLMILLPVAVLAVVGLYSLRQDAQAAEQAARKRAAEDARNLARAIGDMAGEDLQQFWGLQSVWTIDLNTESAATTTGMPLDKDLEAGIAKWEGAHPGLRLAGLLEPECELLTDGREIRPPPVAAIPSPPKWFCDLSPKQRELWDALRQNPKAAQDFLDTNPSDDARLALQAPDLRPEQSYNWRSFPPSETGASFEDLALFQLLKAETPVSRQFLETLWHRLIDTPSFVAPTLLELAEARTNGADSLVQEKIRAMRQMWDCQSATRQHVEPLRKLPEIRSGSTNSFWARWSQTPSDRALAFFAPCLFDNYIGSADTNGLPSNGRGWIISFVPDQVLDAIFARALAANRYMVPDYASVAISVEDEPLPVAGGDKKEFYPLPLRFLKDEPLPVTGGDSKAGGESPLALAAQPFGPASRPEAASLSVTFFLASREKMLAAEQRRARLFGALIGAAVLAALAGLFTARRAFYAQHRLSEMKTNFVSSVSHELRAPIASMRLLAESLERGKIPEASKQKEYYRFLVQESRRLTSLIENVLDFSRIEQGRKEYQMEPSDLDAIAEQTVKLMLPAATQKQVELIWHPGTGPGPAPCCDGLAIQQALINLIDNAIKHSPAGATVTVGREGGPPAPIQLWVEDQGPGIPPEEHGKIFERFYRRGSELRRETQGVGIGLTIVKHIVEAHGGRVLVRSAVGQGSRFTIELPATPEHP